MFLAGGGDAVQVPEVRPRFSHATGLRAGTLRLRLAARAALVVALAASPALADPTKDQCIDANGNAQSLRRDDKLAAARAQLRVCADPACPAMVRDDCSKRLDELEKAQPTIIFDAKDGAGHDLSAVKVAVDGHPVADRLDGTSLRVDPGEHVFVFTAPDREPVTQTFVLKEGEKERLERIAMGSPSDSGARSSEGMPPSTPPSMADRPGGLGGQKIAGLIAGGVGIAGLAVGSVFGLMTISKGNQQKSDCPGATDCPRYPQAASEHSTAQSDRTIATTGFIAGGALLVGGLALFFTAGHSSGTAGSSALLLVPSAGPAGAAMTLEGTF